MSHLRHGKDFELEVVDESPGEFGVPSVGSCSHVMVILTSTRSLILFC